MNELVIKIKKHLDALGLEKETDRFSLLQIENAILKEACIEALKEIENNPDH